MTEVDSTKKARKNGNANGNGMPFAVWRPLFVEAIRNTGNIRAACQKAGISRQAAYKQRSKANGFMREWDEAMDDAIDLLEAKAWQRATAVVESSDTMLIFLLKSHRREVYGDTMRHGGESGNPVRIVIDFGDNGTTAKALAIASGAIADRRRGKALECDSVRETVGQD